MFHKNQSMIGTFLQYYPDYYEQQRSVLLLPMLCLSMFFCLFANAYIATFALSVLSMNLF